MAEVSEIETAETDAPVKKGRFGKRLALFVAFLLLLLIALIIGFRIFLTTRAGASFIETQINSRKIGPLEQVEIRGLSGDPLGEFSVESIIVKDKDGIWVTVRDLSMAWHPFSLLKKHVNIDSLTVADIDVLRKPQLPPSDAPLVLPKITLGSLLLNSVKLDSSLIGRDADLKIEANFLNETTGEVASLLNVSDANVAGEKLRLDFARGADGRLTGAFDIAGVPDGSIATLVKAPAGTDVSGTGKIEGTSASGDGTLTLNFGSAKVVETRADWTDTNLSVKGTANLTVIPGLEEITRRVGRTADFTAQLTRNSNSGFESQPFKVTLSTDTLKLDADGRLSDSGGMPNAARIDVTAAKPERLAELPEGYELGSSQVKGLVTLSPGRRFKGTVSTARIVTPFGKAQNLTGPVNIVQNADETIEAVIDISAENLEADGLSNVLGPTASLGLTAKYDLAAGMLNAKRFEVKTGDQDISVQGQVSTDLSIMDVRGKVALTIPPGLDESGNIPAGKLVSEFTLEKTPESDIALTSDGRLDFAEALAAPLDGIIGSELIYSTAMTPVNGGAKLDRFRVETSGATVEISGTIKDEIDLSGEVQITQALTFASAELDSDTRASFEISGPRTDPNIRLDATSPNVKVGSFVIKTPRLRTELSELLSAPSGPVQLDAETEYGTFTGQTTLTLGEVKSLKDIDLTLGTISAKGDLSLDAESLATGILDITDSGDKTKTALASLKLMPQGPQQGIALTIDAENVAYQKIGFDNLSVKAEGTLEALQASIETKGTLNPEGNQQGFELSSPLTLARDGDNQFKISATPKAMWNDLPIEARSELTAEFGPGGISFVAPLSIDENDVDLGYSRKADQEELTMKTANIPMRLLPLPGPLEDSNGRLNLDMKLSHNGGSLDGTTKVAILDLRGYEVDTGKGLNAEFDVELGAGSGAAWTLTGTSAQGFALDGKGVFPISTGESLAATRPNMDAPVSAELSAKGSAETLLGLVTPAGDEVGGQIDASVTLSGTPAKPLVEGTASGRELVFEVPEIGTQIKPGAFTAEFTNDTLKFTTLEMSDKTGGTLKAQGEFKLGEFGRPIGTATLVIDDFTALDRKDVTATIDGDIKFESTENTGALTGEVKIDKANLRQFVSGGASVIEIEVEEVNRPPELDSVAPKAAGNPIELDLKIRAPRNIFVNSRGLDVELSVDAQIKGTAAEPEFFGKAEVVRGGYKLAGKTLAFETGTIEFNGPLNEAKVSLTAETETQNITATVEISGTVETPEITLSSTPERPQDEILSALLFGRSATELSPVEQIQLASALAQFSGIGSGLNLLGGLRESLGFAELGIGTAADGTTVITGGGYLAKNVYLQIFSGTALDQTGAIIDWEIRPNIALRSKIQQDNDQSLSLKWKKDF